MRKFYSLALLFVASVFCSMAYGYTGKEDITSSKLTNSDFSAMTPVAQTVITYAKDLADNGAGSNGKGLYGMQAVEGWTASYPTDNIKRTTNNDPRDAKVGGIFPVYDALEIDEIENPIGLGGAFYALGEAGKSALGITSVWSGNGYTPIYSQDVTLSAGYYIIIFKIYNAYGESVLKSNEFGFAAGETKFVSDKTIYPVGEWVEDTVLVKLNVETAGKVTLGFLDSGVGSKDKDNIHSKETEHLFVESIKIYTVDEAEVLVEEIAEAKATLLDLINIGKVYNVETAASEAVYNNPNATLAEVEAAIEAQTKINESGVTDLSSYFIVNSHFDEDDPVLGGICTYAKDCGNADNPNVPKGNYSMLPVVGWDRSTTTDGPAAGVFAIGSGTTLGGPKYVVPTIMSDGSSEGKVLGFVTSWSNIVQYKQAVTLPAGSYTLSMSYYNVAGTAAIVKNLIGFVSDDGTEYLSTRTTFPVGQWTKDEIKFTLDEETTGYFTLGYKAANDYSYNMPHFFTDGISLVYVGSGIDPSMFALKAAVSGGNKILASGEPFYTVTEKALEEAIEAGQKLIDEESTDTEANQAAYEKLSGLVNEANASIAAYKKLDAFFNEGGDFYAAREKYIAEAGYKNTASALDLLGDEIEMGLSDYNLSTDRINEIISSLPTVIKTGVQADWDALVASGDKIAGDGLDISILFTGIGENGNYEGWTTTKGSISVQNGVAEIYNNTPFKASKVLEKLPKGKYTVATKGFYRIGSNDVNIDAYEGAGTTGAYVFAGAAKSDMENVASVTFETKDAYTGLEAAGSVFVINNREGANKIFNDPDYADNYNASASTVLTKEGDLTFGVTADQLQDANWVTWYQFSICYNASDISDLHNELAGAIETLNTDAEALNSYAGDYTDDITSPVASVIAEVYNDALGLVDDAEGINDSSEDEEVLIKAIDDVNDGIKTVAEIQKTATENVEAVTKCRDARTALEDFMNNEMSDYGPSQEAINAAYTLLTEDASDDAISALTTDEVNALTVSLQDAIAALKIPGGVQDASDANPVDMTAVIANADIEQGATVAWQYTKNGGNGPSIAAGIEGQSIEFWNSTAANLKFNIWQDIAVLPVGKYELTADASNCLVSNSTNNPDAPGRAFLYAATFTEESDTTYFSSDPVVLQEEQCTEKWNNYSVIFSVNEGETVTIGFQTSGTMAAGWFVCDNFKLTYFGGESAKEDSGNPMEVEGVEAAAESEIVAIYTASGTPVAQLQKGLNIVKYANGTVKKLFVK